jgi:hypothetical protein
MNKNAKSFFFGGMAIALLLAGIFYWGFVKKPAEKSIAPSLGSLAMYNSTTTNPGDAGLTDSLALKEGWGTLRYVNITIAGTGYMEFYDATTSDISKRASDKASTSILMAHFPGSPTVGTYTFNTSFNDGLLLHLGSGSISTTTIVWD